MLFRKSLLVRHAVSFFLLSSLVVLLLAVLSYSFFISGTRMDVAERMSALADLKVEALTNWIAERAEEVSMLAREPPMQRAALDPDSRDPVLSEMVGAPVGPRDFLSAVATAYHQFRQISVLSAEGGRVKISTDPTAEGTYRVQNACYTEGRKGTHVQNVHPSPETLLPTLTISSPIRGQDGRLLGVLSVDLDLEELDRIVQHRAGLGTSGEAYLVDRYAVFVSAKRFGRDAYLRGAHSTGIDAAVRGESGTGRYSNYAGVPVIGVYRWVAQHQLALLVEIHQDEAFRLPRQKTAILVVIGLVLVAALASGFYGLSRRIVAPILAMQEAALRVSAGDLDAQAPILTRDEIGVLAESFNRMTVKVKGLYEEIKRREGHFRSLIESATDVVAVIDRSGRLSFASPSVERVLGYRPEELVGREVVAIVHPEDVPLARGELERLMASEDMAVAHAVVRFMHRDGNATVLEATARRHLDHPSIGGIVVNARDITERRRLEERLIQAQKMEAVGRLAGGVAHDFNNLLTAILGNSEMLLQQEGAGAGASECVLEIRKAAHRAAALTRQLLAYSRRQVLQPKVVDLNELVEGMRKMLARLIGEDVRVVVRPAPGLRSVRVDPFQIEQVIMNLAVNARDAMPDGGSLVIETQNVVLEHEYCQGFPDLAPGAYVMLAVSDSGCGMDAKVMARLFEPFFTTKETGKGTGLGLATVYGIVRQSGGHISAYSEVGRGSTFKVFLPVCEEQRKIQDGIPEPGQDPTGVESVLLVEDEEALRGIAKRILEHSGYRVSVAESAETAMRNLETFGDIDLLVTDVILPGMNGRSLSDTLTRWRPGLKTLYISGHTEDAILHHGVLAEGIAFLQKPFTGQALTRKVREVLDADGVPRSKESTGLVGTPAP